MRKNVFLMGLGLVAAIVWLLYLGMHSLAPDSKRIASSEGRHITGGIWEKLRSKDITNEQKVELLFNTPIVFYGKVIDQYGSPVSQADVRVLALNDPSGESAEKYMLKSDSNGLFVIENIRGVHLGVRVSKEGYSQNLDREIEMRSVGSFDLGPDGQMVHHDANDRAIFYLHKEGVKEFLYNRKTSFDIQAKGNPLIIAMDMPGKHEVAVKYYDESVAGGLPSNWRAEIRVLNGGLVLRVNSLDYEAPSLGYLPVDVIMPEHQGVNGRAIDRNRAERSYFARFNDGTFARFDLEISASKSPFIIWNSYWNPKRDSKHLEAGIGDHRED